MHRDAWTIITMGGSDATHALKGCRIPLISIDQCGVTELQMSKEIPPSWINPCHKIVLIWILRWVRFNSNHISRGLFMLAPNIPRSPWISQATSITHCHIRVGTLDEGWTAMDIPHSALFSYWHTYRSTQARNPDLQLFEWICDRNAGLGLGLTATYQIRWWCFN